jgi:8-hydroxy-5-deazaflavin:NADPH oxidoreductase
VSVIGFIGGTGPLGRGLGLRLAMAGHDVVLGSRTADKAQAAADDSDVAMRGADNATACADAEIVFVTVPFEGQVDLLPALADALDGKIVVSTVVPMGFDAKGPHPIAVAEGSAAEQCARLLPGARIVSGFQSVPAPKLLKPDLVVEMDVPLLSDDEEAAEQVAALANEVKALHGFVAGPLRLSATVEALTPLIISINKRYKAHAGIRFAGLPR